MRTHMSAAHVLYVSFGRKDVLPCAGRDDNVLSTFPHSLGQNRP